MRVLHLQNQSDGVFRYEPHDERHYNFPQHMHHFAELTLMLDGELVISVGERQERLKSGQFAFFHPFQVHGYSSSGIKSRFVIYTFSPSLIADFLRETEGKTGSGNVFDADASTLALLDSKLIRKKDLSVYGIRACLYSVLSDYTRQISLTDNVTDSGALEKTVKYMNEHSGEQLPIGEVAHAVGYSANYLSHLISKFFGFNYCSLLALLRVERAKLLLRSSSDTVLNIAIECGFGSERSFHRQFRRITGRSPKEYRLVEQLQVIELKFPAQLPE